MKVAPKTMEIGGVKVSIPYSVFDNLAEAVNSAGGEAQLVNELNASALPRFTAQRLIVEAVNRLTGVPFLTRVSKNPKTKVSKQVRDKKKDSDATYIARALKAKPAVTAAQIEAELAKSNGQLLCSLSKRTLRAKKPSKAKIKAAGEFFEGTKSIEKLNARFAQLGLASFAFDANASKEANIAALATRLAEYDAAVKM